MRIGRVQLSCSCHSDRLSRGVASLRHRLLACLVHEGTRRDNPRTRCACGTSPGLARSTPKSQRTLGCRVSGRIDAPIRCYDEPSTVVVPVPRAEALPTVGALPDVLTLRSASGIGRVYLLAVRQMPLNTLSPAVDGFTDPTAVLGLRAALPTRSPSTRLLLPARRFNVAVALTLV